MQKVRTPQELHDYQIRAIRHTLDHPLAMLWLDMGLGKTVVSQSCILDRLDGLLSFGTLVIAPKRVCRMVWRQESKAWSHTSGLTFSLIQGTPKQRHYAMRRRADVHLINYDNLPWLVDEIISVWLSRGEYPPWKTIIFDEISKLKDSTGVRSTAMQRITPYFPYRIGLTGTPASNGYTDLFGQYLMVDGGARLGTSYTTYLERYFHKQGYKYKLRPGAEEEIKALIADITLEMSAEEYLPWVKKPVMNDVWVDLPPKARVLYDQLEADLFMKLDGGEEIEVFNQASLINKCLQAANGQPYVVPNSKVWAAMHDEKLEALQEIYDEANGNPILVAYEFQSDKDRILERFKDAVFIGGAMTEREETALQEAWDRGDIPMLVGHPASIGHGLNLQYGGHIGVWFGLTWSLDNYLQFIRRLARQGQTKAPIFHRIMARKTADEIQRLALEEKDWVQADLKRTINQYRRSGSGTGSTSSAPAVFSSIGPASTSPPAM